MLVSKKEIEEMLAIVEGDEALKERLARIVFEVIKEDIYDALGRRLARERGRL